MTCCVFECNAERQPNAEDGLKMSENMRKVLAIEDDKLVARNVARTLNANGFIVDVARTGRKGVERAIDGAYDAVILDRELPDLDGVTVVATLRGIGILAPMLMMSSTCHADRRIEGLRAGADDYMSMPISFDEMVARVEVLLRRQPVLRRQPSATAAPSVLRSGGLELDLVKRTIIHRQSQLGLRPTEFRLLEFMMRHVGRVLTRMMILEAVWDCHFDPGTNLIDVHVGHLRQKLSTLGLPTTIRTIRGSGYRFG
jgi:two-component system, OmpR family, response regulator